LPKSLSQKLSWQLFIWGLVLVPFAVVADSVLDAVLFKTGSIRQELLFPSDRELSERVLISIFILGAVYLGMHFLANTSKKEQGLQQRNKDLALAKQDLELFHDDISSQLRNSSSELNTALGLLKEQCPDIDEKLRFFIDKIDKTSLKLEKQLEINQTLTEYTFGEPHRERVRMDKLASAIVRELQAEKPDRHIQFKVQPLLYCWCDRRMLRQIIHNLFTNAMEFIPASREGQIEFGIVSRNNQRIIFVRDNGVGFSKAQAERLFDPFRDPSIDPDLPQDTILLANTKRIIHRHGGQIWAEGVPGAGGTIFFTYYSA